MSGGFNAILLVKGDDDFAVGMGLEGVRFRKVLAEDFVVVDLAIDCEGD